MKLLSIAACAALAALCVAAPRAQAAVVIAGTRVVFPAQSGEATIRLSNKGGAPALVEAWVDDGNVQSTPEDSKAPFLITPPLFRMEAGRDQSIRILYTHAGPTLPTDRESLFWLNVLEIPPKPGEQFQGKNVLQFAIRSRLKLFYRPPNLGDALAAGGRLSFTVGPGASLVAHNPTPFYVTVSKLSVGDGVAIAGAEGMAPPFGEIAIPLKGLAHAPAASARIGYTTIDDYGAGVTHEAVVGQ
jgi:chaperone protein EcpD